MYRLRFYLSLPIQFYCKCMKIQKKSTYLYIFWIKISEAKMSEYDRFELVWVVKYWGERWSSKIRVSNAVLAAWEPILWWLDLTIKKRVKSKILGLDDYKKSIAKLFVRGLKTLAVYVSGVSLGTMKTFPESVPAARTVTTAIEKSG